MGKKSKALLLALCAVALVIVSVFSTVAYLTSQDSVTNTFTVGKVAITLDEQDVNGASSRVESNAYHLIPGTTYTKDPTVHVDAISESCYVFVKVENGIAAIEAPATSAPSDVLAYAPIADQISAHGWTALDGVQNVYYKEYTKSANAADRELVVFDEFKINGSVDGTTLDSYNGKTIIVTAYAVQSSGFSTAKAAWDATFGASSSSTGA